MVNVQGPGGLDRFQVRFPAVKYHPNIGLRPVANVTEQLEPLLWTLLTNFIK